jgi:hypothetical protein
LFVPWTRSATLSVCSSCLFSRLVPRDLPSSTGILHSRWLFRLHVRLSQSVSDAEWPRRTPSLQRMKTSQFWTTRASELRFGMSSPILIPVPCRYGVAQKQALDLSLEEPLNTTGSTSIVKPLSGSFDIQFGGRPSLSPCVTLIACGAEKLSSPSLHKMTLQGSPPRPRYPFKFCVGWWRLQGLITAPV